MPQEKSRLQMARMIQHDAELRYDLLDNRITPGFHFCKLTRSSNIVLFRHGQAILVAIVKYQLFPELWIVSFPSVFNMTDVEL